MRSAADDDDDPQKRSPYRVKAYTSGVDAAVCPVLRRVVEFRRGGRSDWPNVVTSRSRSSVHATAMCVCVSVYPATRIPPSADALLLTRHRRRVSIRPPDVARRPFFFSYDLSARYVSGTVFRNSVSPLLHPYRVTVFTTRVTFFFVSFRITCKNRREHIFRVVN